MSLTIWLTPHEVQSRLASLGVHCAFTPLEKSRFATTPIVNGTARVFGFPTPADNSNLTLEKIRACVGTDPRHQPSFFDHPWYQSETFMQTPCLPGGHYLSMDVLEGSVAQPLDYVRSEWVLPAAVEVVLMLFLHYSGSAEQLLLKKHTWCSDQASLGRQVTVGAFGRNGVFLSGHPGNFVSRGLGVCASFQAAEP